MSKPSGTLWQTWVSYMKELRSHPELKDSTNDLKHEILQITKEVAGASGGLLGFASVSDVEKKVLDEISAAFS